MPRKSTRPPLVLLPNGLVWLEQLRNSRTASRRDVPRAQVLWLYHTGQSIATIMHAVHLTRKSVAKWISRVLRVGVTAGLHDAPHGSPPKLTEEAKAWVVHVACSQPKDWATPRSFGRDKPWPNTYAGRPGPPAILRWPRPPRRPSIGFWRRSPCHRTR